MYCSAVAVETIPFFGDGLLVLIASPVWEARSGVLTTGPDPLSGSFALPHHTKARTLL